MRDHRKHPRRPIELSIAFRIGDGPRIDAICRDISLGGMFIETTSPAPFGATVEVLLSLSGLKQAAAIPSIVRWTTAEGMGVQFGSMGARETYALTELLGSL
ncbi:PilZ domain-containing protein [Sorangium sp. So ce1182]|uniref:PilZ domain-containing protein n=1 Tax=unclassified Sorangium TaxID=2621164 RepID=UPI003F5F2E5D